MKNKIVGLITGDENSIHVELDARFEFEVGSSVHTLRILCETVENVCEICNTLINKSNSTY